MRHDCAPGLTRRSFLRRTGAASLLPLAIRASTVSGNGNPAPSDRIVLGAIGLGFGWDMGIGRRGIEFAAVCDVRTDRREEAKKRIEKLKQKYSNLATSSMNEYEKRKWYGVCDGIAICLKEFALFAEKPGTPAVGNEEEPASPNRQEDISDLLEDSDE